jgi:hypothetical protein
MVDEPEKTGQDGTFSSNPQSAETPQSRAGETRAPLQGPGGQENWVAPQPATASPATAPETKVTNEETELERSLHPFDTKGAPHSGDMKEDIATILGGVKIPERRDQKGSADSKKPTEQVVQPPAKKNEPPEEPDEMPIVTPLRTLKDDLKYIVRRRKISLVKAVALEEDKKKKPPLQPEPETPQHERQVHRARGILFTAALLVVLGGAALFGVYYVQNATGAAPVAAYPSLVFAEQTVTTPIESSTPAQLKQFLATARGQGGALGSITRVVPTISIKNADGTTTTRPATVQEFFTALGAVPPEDLMRALGDDFFFGFHNTGAINAPVIVITVKSYDRAFRGMLDWEKSINTDLAPLFASVPAFILDQNGLPTARKFQDKVLRNIDARVLYDDAGAVAMYYSFPSPNVLVIAENTNTFSEVFNRLQAGRNL